MIRLRHILAAAALLVAAGHGAAEEPGRIPFSMSRGDYNYQSALFSYVTGDFFSASALASSVLLDDHSARHDEALLLLRLSDLKRLHTGRFYPDFKGGDVLRERMPALIGMFDTFYRMGEYDRALMLADELGDSPAARYFRGMGFLRLGRIDEALADLEAVPAGEPLHPYAAVAAAQAYLMKQQRRRAEGVLKAVLAGGELDGGLSDRMRVLLGGVLFDEGRYEEALMEYLRISMESPLYREALIGQAWALAKLGSFEAAVPIIKEIRPSPPYDADAMDVMVLLGYCYLGSGRAVEARNHFARLAVELRAQRDEIEGLLGSPERLERLSGAILDGDDSGLDSRERKYLTVVRSNRDVFDLVESYRALGRIADALERQQRSILSTATHLDNTIIGLKALVASPGAKMDGVKRLLASANRVLDAHPDPFGGYDRENRDFFAEVEEMLFVRWLKTAGRPMTGDEKRMVSLILKEGAEALECLNSPVVCPIVHTILPDSVQGHNRELNDFRNVTRALAVIAEDLAHIRRGEAIGFEKMLMEKKEQARRSMAKCAEAKEGVERLRGRAAAAAELARRGMTDVSSLLHRRVADSLLKFAYELEDYDLYIEKGLAEAGIAAGAGKGGGRR
ncbi:MAG TPA: hypothetical protein ENJ37_05885 [Deltaproteobacteria bacterium]|nr:hypothetical protein [Deltaproteobacteria bacterium]